MKNDGYFGYFKNIYGKFSLLKIFDELKNIYKRKKSVYILIKTNF